MVQGMFVKTGALLPTLTTSGTGPGSSLWLEDEESLERSMSHHRAVNEYSFSVILHPSVSVAIGRYVKGRPTVVDVTLDAVIEGAKLLKCRKSSDDRDALRAAAAAVRANAPGQEVCLAVTVPGNCVALSLSPGGALPLEAFISLSQATKEFFLPEAVLTCIRVAVGEGPAE